MRTPRLTAVLFAALCCLLVSSEVQAQHAYGYASITQDQSTGTVTGYASTEVDYETAYYYDAEVQAHIEDQNGNWLASGSAAGNPSALTFLDVFQALLCIRFTIVSYVIVTPRFLGCDGGYYDYFGFSDFWWGTYWDYGDFFLSPRNRCIFGRLIYIAAIIADVIRCLPTNVNCRVSSTQVLPGGFRNEFETPYLLTNVPGVVPGVTDRDSLTITCEATDEFGGAAPGLLIRFGLGAVSDDGGHAEQHHTGARPRGSYDRRPSPRTPAVTSVAKRTDGNGRAEATYYAPLVGGTVRVFVTAEGFSGQRDADIVVKVPGLELLPAGDNYRRFGGNNRHPVNHYGTPRANTGLQQIADDYKAEYYPDGWVAPPEGTEIDSFNQPTDHFKIHYNDMSLKYGGKFETEARWNENGSHDEHRVGINCDTRSRNIPAERHERLEDIFEDRGSTDTHDETNTEQPHWHLRFEFGHQVPRGRASTPVGGTPAAVPGRVEAEEFDVGAHGEAYFLPNMGYVGIEKGSPDMAVYQTGDGTSYVGATRGGQWMNYTVNVASSGSYTFETRIAAPYGGNSFHFEVDGVNVTGPIAIFNTGGWWVFQYARAENIWLDAGEHVVRLVIDGGGQHLGDFDSFTISPYYPQQSCSPGSWELDDCRRSGGYWDYGLCYCNYGGYSY